MSGAPYASNAGAFLVQTLFGFYILIVMLRFLLQWVRADFYNPLVQFLVKLTNPPLIPLRRIVPGFMGLDMAAVVLLFALQIVEILLLNGMGFYGGVLGIPADAYSIGLVSLLVLAVAELFKLLLNVFIVAIIIYALMSWINPDPRHPVVALLRQLTAPVMRPARNLLPPISGIDLSPMLVIIVLILLKMLLAAPLWDMGWQLALY